MAKIIILPRDTNKKAKSIVDILTGGEVRETPSDEIRAAAAAMGCRGGLKGGLARKAALSPERRKEIAQKAAAARWGNKND